MRLTCPNCNARYEVADSMVPPEGRDVQCSNCGTTWFQTGRRTDSQPSSVYVAKVRRAPNTEDTGGTALEEITDDETEDSAAEAEAEAAPAPQAPRREIDPAVRDILRQEAEREARLRRGDPDPVETQSEMPLEEDRGAAERARLRAELDAAPDAFADPEDDPQATVGARRELLPDIEEINSTLRATSDRSPEEQTASDIDTLDSGPRRRRGARTGFLLVLTIAVLGVVAYGYADQIVAELPQAEPYLDTFVEQVNRARFWLDDMARSLAEMAQSQDASSPQN